MNEDEGGLGLRWEHHIWPDGTPVLQADLKSGDLYIRFTLSRRDDGQLELAGADMDRRLGVTGTAFDVDAIALHLINLLLATHRKNGTGQSNE